MSYTPRPGSVAERAISHLAASGPMLRADLAAAIGVPTGNLNGNIGAAVRNGATARDTERFWLPAERESVSGDLRPTPGSAIDWTVRQVFATADLPGKVPASLRRGHAAQTLAAAVDNIWRDRVELCRRTGLSQSTVGRMLVQMHARGEVEMMPARGSRAAQFRRVR